MANSCTYLLLVAGPEINMRVFPKPEMYFDSCSNWYRVFHKNMAMVFGQGGRGFHSKCQIDDCGAEIDM